MKKLDIAVIGGVAAGMSAASQARRARSDLRIGVFEKGEYVSYAACGIPYHTGNVVEDHRKLIAIDVERYINERNIEIFRGTGVASVDFEKKILTVRGREYEGPCAYEKLVIATGARAFVPPVRGMDGEGIFTIRSLEDGIALKRFLDGKRPKRGIIIGGGFIGLEMAEALRGLDIETTILEKTESVAMTMNRDIRKRIAEELKRWGVAVFTGINVLAIDREGGRLVVECGEGRFDADFVIAALGVRPNTDFLSESPLPMQDGAIVVDEKSRTGLPDVFSAGDCATVMNLITGRPVYFPLGTTANKQGRVAGLQAAGVGEERFPGIVGTQFVRVFDLEIAKTGFSAEDALRAGIDSRSASVYWKSRAGYYPGSETLYVELTVRADNGVIIGGQISGREGAALRCDLIATAVTAGMNIREVAYLDLGYAPPFAPVWDSIHAAAQKLLRS